MDCKSLGRLYDASSDKAFRRSVQHIIAPDLPETSQERPVACVFAEVDTADYNIRLAVIPETIKRRFFDVKLSFQKDGPRPTTGFQAHICSLLKVNYNLWSMSTHTNESSQHFERGSKRLLVELCKGGRWDAQAAEAHASTLRLLLQEQQFPVTANSLYL